MANRFDSIPQSTTTRKGHTMTSHNDITIDQFTRQADPFAKLHQQDPSVDLLLAAAKPTPADTVLDVACGPGLVACAFALHASHVTGIDLTPAMLEKARALQTERQLSNLTFTEGDVTALPFPDASFSIVLSRYAFHHFLAPHQVLAEMARVTRPGGRILIIDVYTTSPGQAAAYDQIEKLRDPSHTRAVGLAEFQTLFAQNRLTLTPPHLFRFEAELEHLLASTRTPHEPAAEIRALLHADLHTNTTHFSPRLQNNTLHLSFPIALFQATKN